MRISDWSSDVCSSDLPDDGAAVPLLDLAEAAVRAPHDLERRNHRRRRRQGGEGSRLSRGAGGRVGHPPRRRHRGEPATDGRRPRLELALRSRTVRSEEHTSELQSLMRNSYTVFCLKKKTIHYIRD